MSCEQIKLRLVGLGEVGLVEGEVNSNFGDLLVIVEIGDDAGKRVGLMNRIGRGGLRLVGRLIGSLRLLVGIVSGVLSLLDAGRGALVDVMNVAVVACGRVVEFVGVLDDGVGLAANVVLGGAAGDEEQGRTPRAETAYSGIGDLEVLILL